MREIAVVSVARSDYGIYLPILKEIRSCPDLSLRMMISGMHLSPFYGNTAHFIEEDGFFVSDRIEMLISSDSPEGISKSIGLGVIGFSQAFSRKKPDILMVLGDRFDMFSAVIASVPFNIPVAHIHGGEITEGAIDDSIRHAITKMSHIHFVSTEVYAERVIQMGEEPWRVMVSGAPGLDNLSSIKLLSLYEFNNKFHTSIQSPPLLITYHPVTREYEETDWQITELLSALSHFDMPIIITMPNADTNNSIILERIRAYQQIHHQNVWLFDNLGNEGYMSIMSHAAAMVGNSSSGIIEAASFQLPVVNIGIRQNGRIRANNVVDVSNFKKDIIHGINHVLERKFREGIKNLKNPYGDGKAAKIIIDYLLHIPLDEKLLLKKFYGNNT
jgi:UDP-hydrolysing UDP-N-acetyl-D-glucosamine 2-epimerase